MDPREARGDLLVEQYREIQYVLSIGLIGGIAIAASLIYYRRTHHRYTKPASVTLVPPANRS